MQISKILAVLYLTALLLVLHLQGILQDHLLYHSDWFSYSYMTLVMSLPVFVTLILIYGVVRCVLKNKGTAILDKIILGVPIVLILMGIIIYLFEILLLKRMDWFNKFKLLADLGITKFNTEYNAYLCVLILGGLVAVFITRKILKSQMASERIQKLSNFTTLIGILLTCGFFGYSTVLYYSKKSLANNNAKHMIMIVLDGFPTQLLHTYNPKVTETNFDKAIRSGKIFKNAYTNKVYTHGYFGTFYSGRFDLGTNGTKQGNIAGRNNILELLQDNGVKTRLITFHPSGIPDSNNIVSYGGLRSSFLTEHYSWLPDFLRIDYHVFLEFPTTRMSMGERVNAVYEKINHWKSGGSEENLWNNYLYKQIDAIQASVQNSFVLLHVSFPGYSVQSGKSDDPEIERLYHKVKKTDYGYDNQDEAWVKKVNDYYLMRANFYGTKINNLIAYLKNNNKLENTVVLVTADHGTILAKNKIFYGFHSDEEVTRVPLVIFNNTAGESKILVDTQDIAKTVLDYFKTNINFSINGRCLLTKDENLEEKMIPVYTTKSERRKEHFIALYKEDKKYIFNIHSLGLGDSRWFSPILGYEQFGIPVPTSELNLIKRDLNRVFLLFDIPSNNIHPNYQYSRNEYDSQ